MKKYGQAGDTYLVRYGDVWRIGPHLLACGDLERGDDKLLLSYANVDVNMAYVDPPWTASLLSGFRSGAGLSKGILFAEFMKLLVDSVGVSKGDIFLEMGRQNETELKMILESTGLVVNNTWGITYYKKHPAMLIRASRSRSEYRHHTFEGLDDAITPKIAIVNSSDVGDVVFDCCLGRGITSLAAAETGRVALGMELHPRKIAIAIDSLVRWGNWKAERVHTLRQDRT